jgi:hypothetical protein
MVAARGYGLRRGVPDRRLKLAGATGGLFPNAGCSLQLARGSAWPAARGRRCHRRFACGPAGGHGSRADAGRRGPAGNGLPGRLLSGPRDLDPAEAAGRMLVRFANPRAEACGAGRERLIELLNDTTRWLHPRLSCLARPTIDRLGFPRFRARPSQDRVKKNTPCMLIH